MAPIMMTTTIKATPRYMTVLSVAKPLTGEAVGVAFEEMEAALNAVVAEEP